MKNKTLFTLLGMLFLIFLIGIVQAQQQSLGTFKQNSEVMLIQTCDSSSYSNITRVSYPSNPDSNFFAINEEVGMTKNGDNYNYSFTQTQYLGNYIVYGHCDENSVKTSWAYDFEITPSGFIEDVGFYFILLSILGAIILLGFFIKDAWFVVLGGMGLIILGLYSLNNGIVGYRDTFMTLAISIFLIGVGAFLSISAGLQKMEED